VVRTPQSAPNWDRLNQESARRPVAFPGRIAHSENVPALRTVRFRVLVALTLGVSLLLAAGCDANRTGNPRVVPPADGAHPRLAGTNASAPASTAVEALPVAVVRAFWAAYLDLANQPGPFDATSSQIVLERVATGPALDRLLYLLRTNSEAGYSVRGNIESDPRLVSQVGINATVRDCYDDHSGLYRVADGSRVDQDDPGLHLAELGLVHQANGWRVSSIDQSGEPCARS
jgi:hypothetical protein